MNDDILIDILLKMNDREYEISTQLVNLVVVLARKNIINWREFEYIKNYRPEDKKNEKSS